MGANDTTPLARAASEPPAVSTTGKLRRVLIALGIAAIGLIGLYLLRSFAGALLLIFAGILFGAFLDGLVVLARRWTNLSRGLALTIVVVLLLAIVALFLWFAGPEVVHQTELLFAQLPQSIGVLQSYVAKQPWGATLLSMLPKLDEVQISPAAMLGSVSQVFAVIGEIVGAIVFVFFVGLYLAASPKSYLGGLLILLAPEHRPRGREVVDALGVALRRWLVGRAITMTLMGILTTIALWLIDMPLALVLGIIAGLLLFVPYLGAVVAAIPAVLLALMRSPALALWVALIYTGIHLCEGYFITPFVQKRAVELPPALLLSVQILSAALFGLAGVIFSTPLTVIAIVLVQMLYVQDVLGEKIAVLGENHTPAK